ncbi:hypothetical protein MACH17_39180 [Phaeobacter inhibens]|uniref:MATE family efflux transporter n=1 Tax=Phaeobacter inhibens TaxID=221822 RepID=UPI00275FA3D6|nr:MATE family efflux transporter [Phaeobacter inhibens]GLO72401.1 hypothetical protein MACH17_39180 [Phaeobacter inhibens]
MAQKNLTQGAVWRALAAVSAPMSLGILGVLSVGLADAYFLGQLGEAPLAAVGFIYPVTTAVTSLSIGLSAGANAAISQSLGRGDSEIETNRLSVHAIVLGTVVATLVALVFYLGAGALFSVMGAAATTAQYLRIVSWSLLGYRVLVTANAAMNARSKAVWSMDLSLMRIFAIYAPLAWLGVWIFGYAGILGAAVIANLAAVPGAYFTGRRTGLVAH